jgi:hypothetical protein
LSRSRPLTRLSGLPYSLRPVTCVRAGYRATFEGTDWSVTNVFRLDPKPYRGAPPRGRLRIDGHGITVDLDGDAVLIDVVVADRRLAQRRLVGQAEQVS